MKSDPTLGQIVELMNELDAYRGRIVVLKIGGNSIAEDKNFLPNAAKQIKFLLTNGVRVVVVHGGGPQIDHALHEKKIVSIKGADGRRITSPKAMRVVTKVMKDMNRTVYRALIEEGCKKTDILYAATHPRYFVRAAPLSSGDEANLSGRPMAVDADAINRALDQGKIVLLHSIGLGEDGKTLYNINGDDYAMAVAIALQAKRLMLITNVPGVYDKARRRIPMIDRDLADQLIAEGIVNGGMVPKVESALWVISEGVGGVAIIDGHEPWGILGEMLTREGFGTLFQAKIG